MTPTPPTALHVVVQPPPTTLAEAERMAQLVRRSYDIDARPWLIRDLHDESRLVVVIHGTGSLDDMIADAWATKVRHPRLAVGVHEGWYMATRHMRVSALRTILHRNLRQVTICGHSMGAAMAMLLAADLAMQRPELAITVYTFGGPRVGGKAWRSLYRRLVPNTLQVILDTDPVTRLPQWGFHHPGPRLYLDNDGQVLSRATTFWRRLLRLLRLRWRDTRDHAMGQYVDAIARARNREAAAGAPSSSTATA